MNPTLRAVLANRGFLLLWCAYGISAMGDHLSEMAILAQRDALNPNVDITPLQARMTFVFMLPFFVFGPVSGALADRLPRRWIMIGADLARVAIMLSFAMLMDRFSRGFGGEWGPFIPLGLIGMFAALFAPARQAMVPTLVRSDELVSANAMISGLGMIATMIAALVSGTLAQRGLIRTAFNLDACTFALSALCLFFISIPRRAPRTVAGSRTKPFAASVAEGFGYVAHHRRVAQLIGIAAVFWFAGAAVRSVIPGIVKDVYHGEFVAMAWFPAWIGLGMAAGAVALCVLGNTVRSEMAITWSLLGAGLAIAGLGGTTFVPLAPDLAYALGAACAFASGFFAAGIVTSYNALLQRIVPNLYRGRVFGILNLATVGGLLVAAGGLSIPRWQNLDRWAGFILIAVALLLCAVAALTFSVRYRATRTPKLFAFYRNIIEFITRFWYRLECIGPCTIPREGAVVITANHECVIDPLLIHSVCSFRATSFMVAAEYYKLRVAGHFLRVGMCIPVRRGENDIGATKEALRRLRRGEAVGIFIQGGIRLNQPTDQLKNGVALLALRTGAVVIPAYISGVCYHDSMLRMFLTRHRARLVFGPPVDLSEFVGVKGQEALKAATNKVFEAIESLAHKLGAEGAPNSPARSSAE